MAFAAVCFDLYETLITEFDPNWQPGRPTAKRLGLAEDQFEDVWQRRKQERMLGAIDYCDILREACREAGIAVDEALVATSHAERVRTKAAPFARVDGDVLDALRRLGSLGLKLGLISNCAVEEAGAWVSCPFAPLFDAAVFSYAVGCAKPDPAIYRLACRQLGVTPECCLFVGDGGSDELAGAERAGMTAYRATWFLERWPAWRQATPDRARSASFPELRTFDDLVTTVRAACETGEGSPEPLSAVDAPA